MVGSRSIAISRARAARRSRAALTHAAAGGRPAVRSTGGRPSDGGVTPASLACVSWSCTWATGRYDAHVTTTEPGDRRPQLDRPPGDRYLPRDEDGKAGRIVWPPVAVAIGGALTYTVLGGILSITAGLVVVAGFAGWLLGKLLAGPPRAAALAIVTIVV